MASDSITVKSSDGKSFKAFVSAPKAERAGAIVLIQEIFGVNKFLRSIAEKLSEQGYLVVAPDLFHRQEAGVELTDKTQAEWDKAFTLYKGFDENKGVDDLIDTMAAVKAMPQCNGRVGTLGFCLGGKLAFLMSARSSADCNVGFYGVGIEQNLNEKPAHPLLLHIAAADAHVPPSAQAQIREMLGTNKQVTIEVYEGAGHAFGRPASEHYDEKLTKLAFDRSFEFLKKHLSSQVGVVN